MLRASAHMESMTEDHTPASRALDVDAEPISVHRPYLPALSQSEGHTMTTEPNELDEQKTAAVHRISDSIGQHQPVKREGLPGWNCRNHICAEKGIIFVTRKSLHDHQAIVAVNDLFSSLRFERGYELGDEGAAEADLDKDFTYSLLTDILDATPAGRSYADRRARQEALTAGKAAE